MRHFGKRFFALLLSLFLLPAMTACGGGPSEEGAAQQLSGTVYVPAFTDCPLPLASVSASCAVADAFYLAGQLEEEMDSGDGSYSFSGAEGTTFFSAGGRSAIFRLEPDSGSVTELASYAPASLSQDEAGDVTIAALVPGGNDTLWVLEQTALYGMSDAGELGAAVMADDGSWSFQSGGGRQLWRQLDSDGTELCRIDAASLEQTLGADLLGGMTIDGQDRLYAALGGAIAVLDAGGSLLFTVKGDGLWDQLLPLGDGSVGVVSADAGGSPALLTIDCEKKGWGPSYPLPSDFGSVYPGSGEYLFFYDSGDSLYGCRSGGSQAEKLLGWSAADVNRDLLLTFSLHSDGRISALLQKSGTTWPQTYETALLTPTDASQASEKTVLTFATLALDQDTRARIVEFNKHSSRYRIEIRDYSEFNTDGDVTAGLTKLNTEIISGQGPDILHTASLPLSQYAAKGLLEDLWPYLDADPELGRQSVMERALEAAEIDGKLCQVFGSFTIRTAVGAPAVVGDQMGWTLEQLRAALAAMPEGCSIFGQYDTRDSILDTVFSQTLDSYVDWTTGQCRFDSPEFIEALEFCGSFPGSEAEEQEYADERILLAEGRQMLMTTELADFSGIQICKAIFGGDVTFIGYPAAQGSGSSFCPGTGLAMSSQCRDKEGAWSFIRQVLLPGENTYYYGFPVNAAAFRDLAEESMEVVYERDEDGSILLDEKGEPVQELRGAIFWEGGMAELHATTQAEYEQIMALYEATDTVETRDESILQIVRENAAAYFSGDKTAQEAAQAIQSRVKLYVNEQR